MDSATSDSTVMPLGATLGVKLYRFRALMRRQWWVLALTIGIGLAYESYVAFQKPRLFESVGRLNIRDELIHEIKGGWTDTTGNFFGTSTETMRNPVVLGRAQEKVRLLAPQLIGAAEISATIVPRSNILLVSGVGSNPEFTQLYVGAVMEEFLNFRLEGRTGTKGDVMEKLQDQINTTKAELEEQQARLQNFAELNNMEFWAEQGKSSAVFLSGLKNKQAQLQNELQRLENLTPDQLLTTPVQGSSPKVVPAAGGVGSGAPADAGPTFNGELYNEYLRKSQELIQRQAELASWSTVWKPKHPRLQKIQDDIRSLKLGIETIKDQNREATGSRIVTVKAEMKSLDASIETWDEKVRAASRKDAEYQTLQSNVARTQSQLEKLIASRTIIDSGTATSNDPWVVMQKASASVEVPRGTGKHILMGLLGGAIVGLIILLVLDRTDDRIASSSDMLEHFSEPILGQIPNVADTRDDSGLPLLHSDDERYTYAEAFRSLRSSLIFMPNQSDLKTLLITSAIPNEGKSTIASNLAITMAAAGARVMLVDADLRRGDIAQLFAVEGRQGLSNILRGEIDWKAAVQPTRDSHLSIIPRGPVTNQSGELLLKPILMTLLEQFKEHYDLTIFNTAPILATDDTPSMAPNFDGTLMVVRAQFTSARLTKNSLNALYQRQVNVLGLILNCLDTEMPDYYYYRYPKYYAA
ncbi:MAG: polysaccharide biosynthesis transport protein [Chthoniobacter sp.]|jgi:capsular exopolysaccharide synthesis family protein|nr:polysaccharide biosynthesis transport protein [Chthoniobacter sp.]